MPDPGINDVLVIDNRSEKEISGTLSLFDAAGKQWSEALEFGPRQTQRMATSDLLRKSGLGGSYGGFSFQVSSSTSAMDAVHFSYDETSKFSALMEIFSRDPNATLSARAGPNAKLWTMRAPMLALRNPDPALAMPQGTVLQPAILVRNTTAKNIVADIALSWRGDSGQGQVKLPGLQLAPFATQQLQIGALQKQLGIPDDGRWALVTLTTTALPDDLIAIASSRDQSGRYSIETSFAGGSGSFFAGGELQADDNHNAIAAITNTGTKATNALLTLHYGHGRKKYELQQTIAPGDQMWVNLAQLIRNRVADRKGNILPLDVNSVTYDLRDLTPGGHSLTANALAVDNSSGSLVDPNHLSCCGDDGASWDPGSFDLVIDGTDFGSIQGVNQCTGAPVDITGDFTTWSSANSAIAQVTTGHVKGISPGFTTGSASGLVTEGNGSYCTVVPVEVTAPITVFDVGAFGKTYIFVGADPSVLRSNRYQVANSAGTAVAQPPGGTCCADSSDPSDTVTLVAGQNPPEFQFQTGDQSGGAGDRTLTFEYDLPDGEGTSVQLNVTARKFAYATNSNPGNLCGLGYGTNRTYVYTVYTRPDHAAVTGDDAEGAVVTENFNPPLTCVTGTGNGTLGVNGQFSDTVSSACSSKPLTCSQTSTQTLGVAGYLVRTNTLQWTSTGVTYTNGGPNQ